MSGLRRTKESDLKEAIKYMHLKTHCANLGQGRESYDWTGEVWNEAQLFGYIREVPGRCVMEIDGFVVDATNYLGDHVCVFVSTVVRADFLVSQARRRRITPEVLNHSKFSGRNSRCVLGVFRWTEQSLSCSKTADAVAQDCQDAIILWMITLWSKDIY